MVRANNMKTQKTLLQQACKLIVGSAVDYEYLDGDTLAIVYHIEYGNFNGYSPLNCKDYLQGLPSVCTIPFYNDEILATLKQCGVYIPLSYDDAYDLIEAYWVECGVALYNMIK